MRKFFLITKKENGKQPLYVRVRKKNPYLDIWINTHIDVDIRKWRKQQCVFKGKYYSKGAKEVEMMVQDVDRAINYSLLNGLCKPNDIRQNVNAVVFKKYKSALENNDNVIISNNLKNNNSMNLDTDLFVYMDLLIDRIESGTEMIDGRGKNRGQKYKKGTLVIWKDLQKLLLDYARTRKPFSWEDINKSFAMDFINYMENRNYMAKTINKYIGQFIALIHKGQKDNRHKNNNATQFFIKKNIDDDQKATEVYLTAEELNALYKMDLTGCQEIVRDVFIAGCCLCQRVSDYSTLKREHFAKTAKGTQVIKLKQKKTGKTIVIPVLDDKLITIAEKYDYNLPVLSSCVINKQIKLICKQLSLQVPSMAEEMPTVLTKREIELEREGRISFKRNMLGQVIKPKYQMITSHTARRTGITLMYLTEKFDIIQMMHVSGHSNAETFKNYIRLSDEEIAEKIAEKIAGCSLF